MTQSMTVGRFHQGRLAEGRPQALDAWRVTTDDTEVAVRVAGLLGGRNQPNAGGGALAHEVLTNRETVRVLLDGPDAVSAHLVQWSGKGIVHECDGVEFLSPEGKRGQPCGCPPRLEDRKQAARDGRGPMPSIDLVFRIAAEPALGEFHFRTGSWQLVEEFPTLTDALERVDGPAVCDLTMELVLFTTKSGANVRYRKPTVTVLGSPDTVEPEPTEPDHTEPKSTEPESTPSAATGPVPSSTPSTPRRRARGAEASALTAPEPGCSVMVDAALLRRAAQVLGTNDHEETVMAALSEIAAGRRQAAELARLREDVGRIAALADQALQGGSTPA